MRGHKGLAWVATLEMKEEFPVSGFGGLISTALGRLVMEVAGEGQGLGAWDAAWVSP